jgi:hypothetical protein
MSTYAAVEDYDQPGEVVVGVVPPLPFVKPGS